MNYSLVLTTWLKNGRSCKGVNTRLPICDWKKNLNSIKTFGETAIFYALVRFELADSVVDAAFVAIPTTTILASGSSTLHFT